MKRCKAGCLSLFGSCPFLLGSQALFSVLWTFVGHFDICSFTLSCEALFTLLAEFVGPFDEVSRYCCATLTQKCAKNVPSPMKTILHNLQTSPGQTKSDVERSALQATGPPHQSLPDIRGQTKSDLERSALRAMVLRTSLSPAFPDKQSTTSNARRCAPR